MESISSDSSLRPRPSSVDHSAAAPGVGVVFIVGLKGLFPADPPAKEAKLARHS